MKNARLLADQCYHQYVAMAESSRWPIIAKPLIHNGSGGAFDADYRGGTIHLEAESPMGAIFALSQIEAGIRSGHLPEFLGKTEPKFSLRPLWIRSNCSLAWENGLRLSLPKALVDQNESWQTNHLLHYYCRRLLEFGYNAILFGKRDYSERSTKEEKALEIEELCEVIHSYGIRVIVKPDPDEEIDLSVAFQNIDSIDYLFWEATLNCNQNSMELTFADRVKGEVKRLEKVLAGKIPLIYFVPAQDLPSAQKQTRWLGRLSHEMGRTTLLAFPVIVGSAKEDYELWHPFWNELRASMDCFVTPCLPVLNGGCIGQGDGLWPVLPLDLFDGCFSRMDGRHQFGGTIILTNDIPSGKGFLDCNLWISAQMQVKAKSALLYADTWFRAYRPEWDFRRHAMGLKSIYDIAIILSHLQSFIGEMRKDLINTEEWRAKGESVLASLNYLQVLFSSEGPQKCVMLSDYFRYFNKDARRLLWSGMQALGFSLPGFAMGLEGGESLRTSVSESSSGSGIRSGGKVSLLGEPPSTADDPLIRRIIQENSH